jgi:hypothetical protein
MDENAPATPSPAQADLHLWEPTDPPEEREADERRLDGSALGGSLSEVFGGDVTAARGRCSGCGRVAQLAEQHLYHDPRAPGAVLRCSACGGVLLVLVELPSSVRLALRGLSWIELPPA